MKKLIIANWKSNKNIEEVESWLDDFKPHIGSEQEVVIAPPNPFLSMVAEKIKDQEDISLAVQNLSPYPAGSYTGEVCVRNLEGLGVKYAILGHSERRRYFKESHQDVANKVDQCLAGKITPVVCVDVDYLEDQARAIASENLSKCVVAYEPLAAIGTGNSVSAKEVAKVVKEIKSIFGKVAVLYGGSVTPDNDDGYGQVTDGVLVGGASLDAATFSKLLQ
jgi:triosephosphate isomerase (TIM)